VPRLVPGWTKPIVIGRHAFGDQYRATDFLVPGPGTLTMTFTPKDGGEPIELRGLRLPGPGVAMGMYNLDDSIRLRARLAQLRPEPQLAGLPVHQEHDPQAYDGRFKDIFQKVYDEGVQGQVQGAGSPTSTASSTTWSPRP
jgi:isocitrate dehydrogenase